MNSGSNGDLSNPNVEDKKANHPGVVVEEEDEEREVAMASPRPPMSPGSSGQSAGVR